MAKRRPLPMTPEEAGGPLDVVLVTGDAYVDHPGWGVAAIGRWLQAHGFTVGVIAQPEWDHPDAFRVLGRPRLFFGVTAGNMDSMVNRYTASRRLRSSDAYAPGGAVGRRPDRATIAYTGRCKQAYKGVPVIAGGIEASLRRLVHYDFWQDKLRGSISGVRLVKGARGYCRPSCPPKPQPMYQSALVSSSSRTIPAGSPYAQFRYPNVFAVSCCQAASICAYNSCLL